MKSTFNYSNDDYDDEDDDEDDEEDDDENNNPITEEEEKQLHRVDAVHARNQCNREENDDHRDGLVSKSYEELVGKCGEDYELCD